jgi:hypothetical protein
MALGDFTSVVGSEFGEVDNPKYGGYTEAGWDKGAFGESLSGWDNQGFALPPSVLKPYGYGSKNFASNFNQNYEIQVVNPATGQVTTGPLKDLGPGAGTGAGIDILAGSRSALGFGRNFKGPVQYRIVPKGTAAPDGTSLASANASGSPTPMWAQMGGQPPGSTASATTAAAAFQPGASATTTDPALAQRIRELELAMALSQQPSQAQAPAPAIQPQAPGTDYASLNLAPAAGGGGGNYALIQAIRLNRARQALAGQNAIKAGGQFVQLANQAFPGQGGLLGRLGGGGGIADPFEPGGSLSFGG